MLELPMVWYTNAQYTIHFNIKASNKYTNMVYIRWNSIFSVRKYFLRADLIGLYDLFSDFYCKHTNNGTHWVLHFFLNKILGELSLKYLRGGLLYAPSFSQKRQHYLSIDHKKQICYGRFAHFNWVWQDIWNFWDLSAKFDKNFPYFVHISFVIHNDGHHSTCSCLYFSDFFSFFWWIFLNSEKIRFLIISQFRVVNSICKFHIFSAFWCVNLQIWEISLGNSCWEFSFHFPSKMFSKCVNASSVSTKLYSFSAHSLCVLFIH